MHNFDLRKLQTHKFLHNHFLFFFLRNFNNEIEKTPRRAGYVHHK
jgi:hypothetical protein